MVEPRDERLRRSDRLFRRADFFRCYRSGKRCYGSLAVIHYGWSDESQARLGVVAGRRIGNAVARHRAKRWVREIFRRWAGRSGLKGLDLVVQLKPGVSENGFAGLRTELEQGLMKISKRCS